MKLYYVKASRTDTGHGREFTVAQGFSAKSLLLAFFYYKRGGYKARISARAV